jgi:hypothetical protein
MLASPSNNSNYSYISNIHQLTITFLILLKTEDPVIPSEAIILSLDALLIVLRAVLHGHGCCSAVRAYTSQYRQCDI